MFEFNNCYGFFTLESEGLANKQKKSPMNGDYKQMHSQNQRTTYRRSSDLYGL